MDKDNDSPQLRLYIVCLYNSQLLPEALRLAQRVRSTNGIVPGIAEIEALILERGGDLAQARTIRQQLVELEPNNMAHRVHAAYIEWRSGNWDTARQLTETISFDSVKGDAHLLINIAQLRAFLRLPEVLAYAYRARRLAFNNPEVHVQYMMLCLTMESSEHEEAQQAQAQVEIGTAVRLLRNKNSITFHIVDDEFIDRQRGELHGTDSLAQRLIGRQIGEQVVVQDGMLGVQEYVITEIQSKYVYACRQSIDLFQQGILRHPSIDVCDTSDPEFMKRFVRYLDRRAQQQPDIQAIYTQQPVPLSAFARMIRRSIIDVWLAFIESSDQRIFSIAGTQIEVERQKQIVSSATSVVVDLLSLLTIVHLSLEKVIVRRFERVLVPQAILDTLQEYEQEMCGPQPSGTVGTSGGERYFLDIPASYIERKRNLLEGILKFVRESTSVMPTMELIETDQTFIEVVGEASAASVLLAKEQGIAFYCDDLRLRMVAEQQWKVNGFDSQTVLEELLTQNLINRDDYYRSVQKLAQSNYFFVRIDMDGIISVLEMNRMEITPEVRAVFQLLQGPDCDMEAATKVIAQVLKQIWIRQLLYHQKAFILDLALSTLLTERRAAEMIPRLKVELRRNFRLVSFMLPELFGYIDLWLTQQSR